MCVPVPCRQTNTNVVATLVRVSPEWAGGAALAAALAVLADPGLLRVSRDEYFTYLTPPGELYDKSAVPGSVLTLNFILILLLKYFQNYLLK